VHNLDKNRVIMDIKSDDSIRFSGDAFLITNLNEFSKVTPLLSPNRQFLDSPKFISGSKSDYANNSRYR